jgi:hypothetical protein
VPCQREALPSVTAKASRSERGEETQKNDVPASLALIGEPGCRGTGKRTRLFRVNIRAIAIW